MPPVSIGEVYAITFERIDHEKYCVITGISQLGTYIYSVFINSSIEFIARAKPHLLHLQVPITQNNNRFLSHDSYVGCDHNRVFRDDELQRLHANGYCRKLGNIHPNDLITIQDSIINSDLLSPEELQLYFQIPI